MTLRLALGRVENLADFDVIARIAKPARQRALTEQLERALPTQVARAPRSNGTEINARRHRQRLLAPHGSDATGNLFRRRLSPSARLLVGGRPGLARPSGIRVHHQAALVDRLERVRRYL
ncbi:MAG TPA: hypothetical protein VGI55_09345, partial [Solirubrobacteraceae bacterium]